MKNKKHSTGNEKEKEEILMPENDANTETFESSIDTGYDETDEELDQLNKKCDDLNDKNLRLMAEFDNYRKRTLKEKSDLIKTANERVFIDFLPLIDDFERALQAVRITDDVQAIKEGIDLIYTKFINFLTVNGVKVIPTENEPFDVDVHEAITLFPAQSEDQKGKIIDCMTKGYTLNDKVIRFAKVVVGE